MPNSANIVPILDQSGSMGFRNYITPAKSALGTFVNMFQIGDSFNVLGFSDNVMNIYPASNALAAYTDPSVLQGASTAITAQGTYNTTNIGDAIVQGRSILGSAQSPRAMVLLSDGEFNVGPDPTGVNTNGIPVHCIALGNDGQTQTLQTIARNTGGQYLFTPDQIQLASLYFSILDSANVGRLVYLARQLMPNRRVFSSVVKFAGGQDVAAIGVNWADPSITYTTSAPGNDQITVQVLDPNFQPVTPLTFDRRYGFVSLTIANPMAGDWYVNTTYYGSKNPTATAAALDPDLLTTVAVDAPATVQAGQAFVIRTSATHDAQPLAGTSVGATAEVPSVRMDTALKLHRTDIAKIAVSDVDPPHADRADLVRLETFRRQRLPYVDILPRHAVPAAVRETGGGEHELTFQTNHPGEYTVQIEAVGPHPNGGEFMRTKLVTVSVR